MILRNQSVLLANGARHPFGKVHSALAVLELLGCDPRRRDILPILRNQALGLKVSAEDQKRLGEEGFLKEGGGMDPVLKDLLLSGVCGDESGLHLVSPFTNRLDRNLHELYSAKTHIRSAVDDEERADRIINEDAAHELAQHLFGVKNHAWVERDIRKRLSGREGPELT